MTRTRSELDLLDQRAVHAFLAEAKPDYIFIAAAKVGGIQANNLYRADFLYENLIIEANLIHGAHLAGVQRLMFLGSSIGNLSRGESERFLDAVGAALRPGDFFLIGLDLVKDPVRLEAARSQLLEAETLMRGAIDAADQYRAII